VILHSLLQTDSNLLFLSCCRGPAAAIPFQVPFLPSPIRVQLSLPSHPTSSQQTRLSFSPFPFGLFLYSAVLASQPVSPGFKYNPGPSYFPCLFSPPFASVDFLASILLSGYRNKKSSHPRISPDRQTRTHWSQQVQHRHAFPLSGRTRPTCWNRIPQATRHQRRASHRHTSQHHRIPSHHHIGSSLPRLLLKVSRLSQLLH
jgi:hypothetical protein